MTDYYEVIPNTEEYEMAHNVCYCVDDWRTDIVKSEFEQELGAEIKNSMCTDPHHLICSNVPDEFKSQFKKNENRYGHYEAKVKSKINLKFIEIVRNHNLKYYDMIHFTFMFNCIGYIKHLYHTKTKDTVRYFIEVQNIESKPDYFNDHKSLTPITESDFLTIRAASAKENELNS